MSDNLDDINFNSLDLPTALNFSALKDEGIRIIQELSGGLWTDFNEHDPGVTTLEQLAYSLTDLGFRSEYPIEDILEQDVTMRDKGTFFTAKEILTVNPVLINDFRKFIIDRIDGIKNAWMEPLVTTEAERDIEGLFLIFLEVEQETNDASPKSDADLVEEVKVLLQENGNLMEACEEVVVLEKMPLKIEADIEIGKEADLDKVHAEVLFALYEYFVQNVPRSSLNSLVKEDVPVDEIFEGPAMDNGFITDEVLFPKMHVIYNSQLVGVVKQVEDIVSVRQLSVTLYDSEEGNNADQRLLKDGVMIDLNRIAYLNIDDHEETVQINYYKRDIQYSTNSNSVEIELDIIQALNQEGQASSEGSSMDFAVPDGTFRDLEKYYSIQNEYPGVYGIGSIGLPSWVGETRQGQAKQFKSYLLFFEQILADHLSQLANVNSLFSLDKEVDQTYFGQPLSMVPNVEPLVNGSELSFLVPLQGTEVASDSENTSLDNYADDLQKLIKAEDPFFERRSRFLDHLLGRFAENLVAINSNSSPGDSKSGVDPNDELDTRIEFLKNYPDISANRAKGYDPNQEYWDTTNISGIEKRVKLVMGIDLKAIRLTHATGFNIEFLEEADLLLEEYINVLYDELEHSTIIESFFPLGFDTAETMPMLPLEEPGTKLVGDHDFKMNRGLFEKGGDLSNYHYGPNPDDNGLTIILVFRPGGDGSWWIIGCFSSLEILMSKVLKLAAEINEKNDNSEGFYTVDHLKLRPEYETNQFGILFPSKHGLTNLWALKSVDIVPLDQLQDLLLDVVEQAREELNIYYVEEVGRFTVNLRNGTNGTVVAKIEEPFETEESAIEHRDYWRNFFKQENFTDLDKFAWEKVDIFRGGVTFDDISGVLYSQQVSVVLPTWPGRFRNQEFRSLLKHLFREAAPASGLLRFLWLNYEEMVEFENHFSNWLAARRNLGSTINNLNYYAHSLMWFLLRHDETRNPDFIAKLAPLFEQRIADLKPD